MTQPSGKSERRQRLKLRRERRAIQPVDRPESPTLPHVVPDAVLNAVVGLTIGAFSLGGGVAITEGHGERPEGVHHPTQAIAKLAAAAQTSTGSSGLFRLYDTDGINRYLALPGASVTPPL